MAKKKDTESKELINWQEKMREEAQAVAKTERVSADRLSFKSGILSYMDKAMPDNEMECIIVASATEQVLYTERYNPDKQTPPDCFALARPGEDLIPHEVVPEPINSACAGCKYNKFNSDLQGGKGKACKERRRLAVMPPPGKIEDIAEAELVMASIPTMSVKNWAAYVNTLASQGVASWGMLTLLKVVPDPRSQFRVTFSGVRRLPDEYLGPVHSRIAAAETMLLAPYEMNPEDEPAAEDSGKY